MTLSRRIVAEAVTLARGFTDTFAGIRPSDTPGFVVAQLPGAFAATLLFRWLVPSLPSEAKDVVLPHVHAGRE
jgi:glycerol uptake facilitator-like aquaporin